MRLGSMISIVLALALVSVGCGDDPKPKPSGGKAKQMMDQGQNQGSQQDGETCGPDLEGAGFCADDYSIMLCSDGDWWLIDCDAYGMYCGEEDGYVDCYDYDDGGDDGGDDWDDGGDDWAAAN